MAYARSYGLIETLAPLHVGASAGEESGNLNLIFRDAYTQTGIIPGSSIRGRFRAEARRSDRQRSIFWFGGEAGAGRDDISEARIKFEYASLVWLPVFCPGQPVVWVSCPRLLARYRRIADSSLKLPEPYVGSPGLRGREAEGGKDQKKALFFNLGFMDVEPVDHLDELIPAEFESDVKNTRLVVVDDADIGLIHDMALYRQSRVKLKDSEKTVENFFNVEALPEGCMMIFPIAINNHRASDQKQHSQSPFDVQGNTEARSGVEVYFGGLESIGFGRCFTMIKEVEK
jgi:CRISPR-associated protein Cmr4